MVSEIRTLLAGELHQLADDLAGQADALRAGSEEAALQCLGLCERLGQVAGMIETPVLQEVALFLMSNVPALLGNEERSLAPAQLCSELERCLLEGPQSTRWADLAANLCDSRWPAALDTAAAQEVMHSLKALAVEEAGQAPIDKPVFTLADLTLQPSSDVGTETLRAFFHEAPLQATQLQQLFGRIRDTLSIDEIGAAQRLAHTLKGSSALCGLQAIAHLAHALEALLQRQAEVERVSRPTRDRLLEASDMIESLIELAAQQAAVPESLPALIDGLYDRAGDLVGAGHEAGEGAGAEAEDAEVVAAGRELASVAVTDQIEAVTPAMVPMLHVPTALIDENLRRAGEINLAISQLNAQVSGTLARANRLMDQLGLVQSQVYEFETLVDTRGTPAMRLGAAGSSDPQFDPLELDEYTALHSLSRAFSESTLDSRELSRELSDELLKLQNLLAQHARLGRELTDSVMNARLVSVATIVPRLERIVRQVARQTGREVQLEITGRDLSIDTDILNGLVEPLMHALRNAVDHGIEPASERRALGKPEQGRIELSFLREGNRIEVACRDDGRGLDYEEIERRAMARGLLAADRKPTQSQLTELIFTPGFSTRDAVSAVSGRGVGMDVVRSSIERLKGAAHLESRAGAGCVLTFRLPLSLTAAHALFVSVADAVYGLPSTTVDQVLYSDAGRVLQLGDGFAFEYGGQVLPLHSLSTLIGQSGRGLEDLERQPRPLVIVHADTGRVALAVEQALDSRQVIIKGLSAMLPTLPGVTGACVLPDGGVGVILEVRELLRQPVAAVSRGGADSDQALPAQSARRALVVDDSLSARRALEHLLSDGGYSVVTATDGLDALTRLEEQQPDLILVDLEMPRMNGLEMTSLVRSMPDLQALPIVMITSRGAEKHRAQARQAGVTEFMTKPYLEHELLDRLYALVPPG